MNPIEIQATLSKVQTNLQAVQTDLARITATAAAPAAVATRRVEIIPEIYAPKTFRAAPYNLVGVDDPYRQHMMRLPRQASIPEDLATLPIPPEIQSWGKTTYGPAGLAGAFFDDLDKNGQSTWEVWAFGNAWYVPMYGWILTDGRCTLNLCENVDSGITHTIEVGDGKIWRLGVEGVDYKPMDLTGRGYFGGTGLYNGVRIKTRTVENLHPMKSALGFLRIRLSKDFV